MSIDIVRALKSPFQSETWFLKLIIGSILFLIPIANFITFGYIVKALQNYIEKNDTLPEYSDLGALFITGAKIVIGYVIFSIPFVILTTIIYMASGDNHTTSIIVGLIETIATILGMVMAVVFCTDEKILSMIDFSRGMKLFKNNSSGFISLIIFLLLVYVVYGIIMFLVCIPIITIVLVPFLCYPMLLTAYNVVGQFASEAPLKNEIRKL